MDPRADLTGVVKDLLAQGFQSIDVFSFTKATDILKSRSVRSTTPGQSYHLRLSLLAIFRIKYESPITFLITSSPEPSSSAEHSAIFPRPLRVLRKALLQS